MNPNLIVADELIKSKKLLAETLANSEAIALAELKDCENLNPYKDWIIKVIKQAKELSESVSEGFLTEIERMTKAKT